jgi:hypothetical protein
MIPVVNYGRMERLRPPEVTEVPMNLNTLSIIFIVFCVVGLYVRYTHISRSRELSYT